MRRCRKSKGVSWAHDVNLCQVKLFSSEDCPSKVGRNSCKHLQTKASWMLPPHSIKSNDCPPGFNMPHLGNQLADISGIPLIKWNCPPKFVMSCDWRVAAGEESTDIKSQNFREIRLLEAIYPQASDIPPSASDYTKIEGEPYNDTPLVPIIPIEEDECGDMELDSAAVANFSRRSVQTMASSNVQLEPTILRSSIETSSLAAGEKPTEKLVNNGVDVVAAASAAFAVLMKGKEQGSMIDANLLIKIFSDPTMIQDLTNILPLLELVSESPAAIAAPISVSKPVTGLVSLPIPESNKKPKLPNGNLMNELNRILSSETTLPQLSNIAAADVKPASVPSRSPAPALNIPKVKSTIPNARNYSEIGAIPGQANIAPLNMVKGQTLKDANYYKNLIRQHGDQKDGKKEKIGLNGNNHNHHNLNMVHEMTAENLKAKNQKYCIYFNTPKGCRNGANCSYKHGMPRNLRINKLATRSAKRMKLLG